MTYFSKGTPLNENKFIQHVQKILCSYQTTNSGNFWSGLLEEVSGWIS